MKAARIPRHITKQLNKAQSQAVTREQQARQLINDTNRLRHIALATERTNSNLHKENVELRERLEQIDGMLMELIGDGTLLNMGYSQADLHNTRRGIIRMHAPSNRRAFISPLGSTRFADAMTTTYRVIDLIEVAARVVQREPHRLDKIAAHIVTDIGTRDHRHVSPAIFINPDVLSSEYATAIAIDHMTRVFQQEAYRFLLDIGQRGGRRDGAFPREEWKYRY